MAAIIYKNAAGKRLPSVTTILGNIGWNKDQLVAWANREGLDGRNCRETSGAAATVGSLAHLAIEASIKGQPFIISDLKTDEESKAQIASCLAAWNDWCSRNRVTIIGSEVSMVSERYQYGGTTDVATMFDKRGLLDLKTGGGTYPDHLVQVAAYGQLWNELHPGEEIEEYHLLRLGKDDASFHHHYYPARSMQPAWEAFTHALALHNLAKKLKAN